MVWDTKEYDKTVREYRKGRVWANDITVEIEGGEAKADPLQLLRLYEQKPDVDTNFAIATLFCNKKRVVFRKNEKEIYSFVFTGDNLADYFDECPWLMDVLFNATYAILVKKLTPPSNDSEIED